MAPTGWGNPKPRNTTDETKAGPLADSHATSRVAPSGWGNPKSNNDGDNNASRPLTSSHATPPVGPTGWGNPKAKNTTDETKSEPPASSHATPHKAPSGWGIPRPRLVTDGVDEPSSLPSSNTSTRAGFTESTRGYGRSNTFQSDASVSVGRANEIASGERSYYTTKPYYDDKRPEHRRSERDDSRDRHRSTSRDDEHRGSYSSSRCYEQNTNSKNSDYDRSYFADERRSCRRSDDDRARRYGQRSSNSRSGDRHDDNYGISSRQSRVDLPASVYHSESSLELSADSTEFRRYHKEERKAKGDDVHSRTYMQSSRHDSSIHYGPAAGSQWKENPGTEAFQPISRQSPTIVSMGRSQERNLPAWKTNRSEGPVSVAPSVEPVGMGRGVERTRPSWMTNGSTAAADVAPSILPPCPKSAFPSGPVGGGRGAHKTLPAWMTKGT